MIARLLIFSLALPLAGTAIADEPTPKADLQQLGQFLLGQAEVAKKQDADDDRGTVKPKPHRVALFNLKGVVSEKPASQDDPFNNTPSESLTSLTKRMRRAADDRNIKAVVVILSGVAMGRAQSEELGQAMQYVRSKDKPLYTHADSLMMGGYTLLCQADRLSVSPEGAVIVTGLYGGQMYLKGLFDKMGIEPDFIAIGDYKSAGEMFTRYGPSDAARENLNWLFDDLYESMLDQIATGRGVSTEQAIAWIDEGVYSGSEAVADGLIDAAETREQLVAVIEEKLGGEIKFEKNFGKDKKKSLDLSTPFGVLNFYAELLSGPKSKKLTKPTVAIVHVNGAIMDGAPQSSPFGTPDGAFSQPIRKALLDVAEDEMIKAVVLRVDSPGGSAIASEVILQASKVVAEKKPLVVSMGNVAASGGYYVSMAGEKIYADETTITGSIGVVSGKIATDDAWGKIGIEFVPFSRGKNADLFSASQPWSKDQKAELKQWMLDAYGTFTGHVKANRGDKLTKPIDDLAGGRVYSGTHAKEIGLVDEIGTIHDAVIYAAEKAGLEAGAYDLRAVPRPKSFFELFAADLQPKKDEHPNRLQTSLLELALPMIESLDPVRVQAVKDALLQAEILRHNRVGLVAPIIMTGP